MSYRRLLLWIFVISTMTLGVAWWHSMLRYTFFVAEPGIGNSKLKCTIGGGAVVIEQRFRTSVPHVSWYTHPASYNLRTQWTDGMVGKFSAESTPDPYLPGGTYCRIVSFPMWLVWLLLNGGALVLTRWLEKRAGRVEEKRLAEGAQAVTGGRDGGGAPRSGDL